MSEWRMLPVAATPEMKRAAVVYANGNAVYRNVAAEALTIEESIYGEVYEAMIAAAPTAQPSVADLRDAKWLDPECADRGACQSLRFKAAQPSAHPAPSEETVSALRDCLSQIDMAACYASEEDTKSVADALLMIGMQARKALALLAASTDLVAPAAQAEK